MIFLKGEVRRKKNCNFWTNKHKRQFRRNANFSSKSMSLDKALGTWDGWNVFRHISSSYKKLTNLRASNLETANRRRERENIFFLKNMKKKHYDFCYFLWVIWGHIFVEIAMLTPCMHLGVQHPPGEGLLPTHHAGRPHYQMDTLFLFLGQKTH